jgi:uncharacterized membrane protein (DUF4010 family)
MDPTLLLAAKVAAAASIGLVIGLEREWAHKEAGVRSFAIAALLGAMAWLVSPILAYVQLGIVLAIILIVNFYSLQKEQTLEVTTSLALAATNVLGILVGMGSFFIAFTCAIVITALLSWKTEMVSFTSKLTVAEIRGTLLMAFLIAVVYPLLPDSYVDPWHIVNPRAIWLTVIIVSALNFVNYVLLRQFGMRAIRYSAFLGGFVSSAATCAVLGEELKASPEFVVVAPAAFLLADIAMLVRNGILVAIFSWAAGSQGSIAVIIVLGPMALVAATIVVVIYLRSGRKRQAPSKSSPLTSPLALRSVLIFSLLFFSLTVFSGLAQRFFGAIGFLAVVVVGALASAASSAVLVGTHLQLHEITASPAAIAIYFASVVALLEDLTIFYAISRNKAVCLRLAFYLLLVIAAGGVAAGVLAFT